MLLDRKEENTTNGRGSYPYKN